MRTNQEIERFYSTTEPRHYDRLPDDVLTDVRFIDKLGFVGVRAIDENSRIGGHVRRAINARLPELEKRDPLLKRNLERWRYVPTPRLDKPETLVAYENRERQLRERDAAAQRVLAGSMAHGASGGAATAFAALLIGAGILAVALAASNSDKKTEPDGQS